MRMDQIRENGSSEGQVEFVKGCPLCEQSDADLERLLGEFAQWLYGVMLADQKRNHGAGQSGGVDNTGSMHTLKERSDK
jgi:hypothetical protein